MIASLLMFCMLFLSADAICSSSQIQCRTSTNCINLSSVCDGKSDCPEAEDESRALCDLYFDKQCSNRGHAYCHSGYRGCKAWSRECGSSECARDINSTLCDALNERRLPEFSVVKPPEPPVESVDADDLAAFLKVANSTAQAEPDADSCPVFYNKIGDKCFAFLPFLMSWPEAVEACNSIGGNLVEFPNFHLFKILTTYLQDKGFTTDYWTGGFFHIAVDAWRWNAGKSPITLGTPYWTMRYNPQCKQREINMGLGLDTRKCYHYHQAPVESSAGQCAALDFEYMYFLSDSPCIEKRKPLCHYKS